MGVVREMTTQLYCDLCGKVIDEHDNCVHSVVILKEHTRLYRIGSGSIIMHTVNYKLGGVL